MKPATTLTQLAILEQALGLSRLTEHERHRCRRLNDCPRNFLVTDRAHPEWIDLAQLEQRGLLLRSTVTMPVGPDTEMFHVTESGFDVLRSHGRVPAVQGELFA